MTRITPTLVLDAATALLASGGEPAVSMRALATALGVSPMAVYRHYRDRDDLLVAVVERVAAEVVLPPVHPDAVHEATDVALCLHDLLVEHPWMVRLIATGRLASPAGLRFPERLVSCAHRAGLGDDAAFVFYRTMFATVLGQAVHTSARRYDAVHGVGAVPPEVVTQADDATTPAVARLAPRWRRLDAAATPRAVIGAVAAALVSRPPLPDDPDRPHGPDDVARGPQGAAPR